ncbi:MAG TPA: twin-arginine translocase TatA/TatE family subunit [Candidatus Thermoplasmatota archaeon]
MAFSGMEWIIVGVIVIALFFGGAKMIPQFAQSLGKARGEYERGKLQVEKELGEARAAARVAGQACGTCGRAVVPSEAYCSGCGTARPQLAAA